MPTTARRVSSRRAGSGAGAAAASAWDSLVGGLGGSASNDVGSCCCSCSCSSFSLLRLRFRRFSVLPSCGGAGCFNNAASSGSRGAVRADGGLSAARSQWRCARVYSSTQRWLCGWRAALACESSSRIVVAAEWPVQVCGCVSGEGWRSDFGFGEGMWGVRAAQGVSRSLMVWTLRSIVRGDGA